jgi:primosomal protein N' (replication factor Y)
MSRFVAVAVPVPLMGALTYRVPDDRPMPARGARVIVQVAGRHLTGCVVAVQVEAPADVEVRPIEDVLDEAAFLPGHVIDLAQWAAEYYAAGEGESIAVAMPPFALAEGRRAYAVTDRGREALAGAALSADARAALEALDRSSVIGKPAAAGADLEATLRQLRRRGLIAARTVAPVASAGFVTVRVAALTAQGLEIAQSVSDEALEGRGSHALGLGARQLEALLALRGAPDGMPLPALTADGIGADTVRRLVVRGLASLRSQRRDRDPFARADGMDVTAADGSARGARELTGEQADVCAELEAMVATGQFHVALLHGVTGSGKTEVYLRLARTTLARNRRVLLLVPEIALTPALAAIFRRVFGQRVAIQHSGLSDGERHDQWHRIRRGEIDIVVGTRSAVFSPLDDVGLIVVDEEHDGSYKQEESPRYNGRDLAIVRGRSAGAIVVLGSATPSLESYSRALDERYRLLTMTRRVLDRPLAAVRVVNMREEMAEQGTEVVLSRALVAALQERRARGEQALLLLNRRGFATSVFCRQCGATLDCPNCSVSLTVHHGASRARGRCHYCNYGALVPPACTNCAAPYLEHVGFGTERVEDEVRAAVPGARVVRVDRDSMQRRGAIQQVLSRFARGEIDVIVGTQMIAKGHDFPAVTLVGVISADIGLGVPDFRAGERTFQLLTQVAGRAGRGTRAGEAIIQSLFPEHYSIELATRQEYRAFYDRELTFRRAMRYPPLVGMINVIVRGPSFGRAMNDASDLAGEIRSRLPGRGDIRVLGPAPAPLGKLRGQYRAQLFLKSAFRRSMRELLMEALAARPELRRRVAIDVDPLSVI